MSTSKNLYLNKVEKVGGEDSVSTCAAKKWPQNLAHGYRSVLVLLISQWKGEGIFQGQGGRQGRYIGNKKAVVLCCLIQ